MKQSEEYHMTKITKDMNIMEIIEMDQGSAAVFMDAGMHCLGCAAARFENLEQACGVHGLDVNVLVDNLNKYFENKK
jgi:hybrid cluster-associated redox disulfide protein